jgi:hypothetical protein
MPFTIGQFLAGLILPAVLVAVGIALAWRPWNRAAGADARWILAPFAAAGFTAAYFAFEPHLGWPPTANVIYCIFYFAMVVSALGFLDAILKPPLWLRAIILLILWRLAIRLLLMNQIPRLISAPAAEVWIDSSSFVTLCWWLVMENLADRSPGAAVPLLLTLFCAVGAIILAMALHIQSFGALAGSLAAMSVAALVLSLSCSRITFSRGLAQIIVLILQVLLVHGYFYTDDTLTTAQQTWLALFLASPLLAFIGDLPPLHRSRPAWRLAARALPVAVLLSVITGVTVRDYLHAEHAQATMTDEP